MEIFDSPPFLPALASVKKYFNEETYKSLRDQCCTHKGQPPTGYKIFPELLYHEPELERSFGTEDQILDQWNHARIALRDAIWDGHELTGIQEAHPILSLISSSWWDSINFVDWVKGWGDTTKGKALYTVSALLGWSLFSRMVETQVTIQAMTHSKRARFLLVLIQDITRFQNQEPFWHEVIPELKESLATREEYENWQDDEGESEIEPSATEEELVPEDQGQEHNTSRRLPISMPSGDTTVDTNETYSGDISAVQPNESRRKAVKEVLRGRRSIVSAPNKRKTSRNAIAPISRAIIRDSSEEQPEHRNNQQKQREPNPSGTVLLESDGSRCTTGQTISDRRGEISATNGGETPALNIPHTSVFELLRSTNPGHIAINAHTLLDSPGNILALQKFTLAGSDRNLLAAEMRNLQQSSQKVQGVLDQIEKHRKDFRSSLLYIATLALKSRENFPFSLDFAVACLQRDILAMRDIFIARLAGTFSEHYGGDYDQGLAEAILMAHSDGLFDTELVYIDKETGIIEMDMMPTFPAGIREHVKYDRLEVGRILDDEISLIEMKIKRMNRFLPVHGYGVSRKEVEGRGMVGVAHIAGRVNNQECRNLSNLIPDESAFSEAGIRLQSQEKEVARWIATPAKLIARPPGLKIVEATYEYVAKNYVSPWSSGNFLPPTGPLEGEPAVLSKSVYAQCDSTWARTS
ncbi:hypothetical protein RSOLAG22IIIB_08352 [Rhizoctonia solani]|uniref:Uncharacterized protein n=1 Tax=Rhizoctonia solani TaxID=456999 RepID=A0A0K6FSJ9_9AGAM|nr:hypothetical protein RSOLAG22IIIB_08352 [Rhizoctonia solani]